MGFFKNIQPRWFVRWWNHTYRHVFLGIPKPHLTSVSNFNVQLYAKNSDEHWDVTRYRGCEKYQREYYDSDYDDENEDDVDSKPFRNSNGHSSPARGKRIRQAIGLTGLLIALASAQYLRKQASNEKKRQPVKETKWTFRPYRR